jgi:NtrC-family two-component system response regulator AlgB
MEIAIPPLRERIGDIPRLAECFIMELRPDRSILGFTLEALSAMRSYRWPGNIRELRNVIERAVVLCHEGRIGLGDLALAASGSVASGLGDPIPVEKVVELHIRLVLARAKSLEEAARVLGMDPATLYRRRKRYGI